MSVYEKLRSLAIDLPGVPGPRAEYMQFVRSGHHVFLSGHIAKRGDEPWPGKLGVDMTTEQGKAAARGVAIELLGTLHAATGDLDGIARIVKLVVLVNSSPTYSDQHIVANGASGLLKEVFGERGAHARTTFGVAQIPLGACVEIDLIAELVDER